MNDNLKSYLTTSARAAIAMVENDHLPYDEALARCGLLETVVDLPGLLLDLADTLPDRQLSTHDGFGAPSVNLAHGVKTRVDINVWYEQDTSIHSHAFMGAFGVVHGEASEEQGRQLLPVWHHNKDCILGDIELVRINSCLVPGNVRCLTNEPTSFHRVGHLTSPTVICVLRESNTSGPGYEYFLPAFGLRSTLLEEFGASRAKLSTLNAALRGGSDMDHILDALDRLPLRLVYEYSLVPRRFGLSHDTAFYRACIAYIRKQSNDDPVAAHVLAAQKFNQLALADWFRGLKGN